MMSDWPPLVCCSGNCRHGGTPRPSVRNAEPARIAAIRKEGIHLHHMDKRAMRMTNGHELVECSIMGRSATPGPERRELLW